MKTGVAMKAGMRWLSVFLYGAGTLAVSPQRAQADGCAFPQKSAASLEVTATKQRALVWLRGGSWEVHIQPVFQREEGSAAWVVPFPSLPEVSLGAPDLFHHLEVITSPVFIDYCYESPSGDSGGCGPSKDASGGGDSQKSAAKGDVTVWASGQVGELDYVILSADDGDDLVGWLETRDYHLPAGTAELIADFETEGQFFFVAQLFEDANPDEAHPPVRFVLPEEDNGFYPLRLTSLAVAGQERLALTLFFAFPEVDDHGFLPQSHNFQQFTWNVRDKEAFETRKEGFFAQQPTDTLLMLFGRNLGESDALDRERCLAPSSYEPSICVSYDELGVEVPSSWGPELSEMKADGAWLYRFEGQMDSQAMSRDLVLGPVAAESLPELNNLYLHNTGSCPTDDGDDYVACTVAGSEFPATWFLLAVVVLGALFIAGRRRER